MLRRLITTSVLFSVLSSSVLLPTAARSETTFSSGAKTSIKTEEAVRRLEVLGITFEAPADFSEVQALDRETAGIIYPNGDTQNPQMVVRFAEIPSNTSGWVQFSPTEQMTYAKYLFLGNNNVPSREFSQRKFFGKTLTGEVQTVRTRTGFRYIEMYIVPLERSQRKIAIAFESDTMLSLGKVETTIDQVTQSMYEMSKSELKKYRKLEKKRRKEQKKLGQK